VACVAGIRGNPMTQAEARQQIEKRGYIWQCRTNPDKERFRPKNNTHKAPCYKWNSYFGIKWASKKKDAKWQGICKHCATPTERGRKRQLNIGNVLPEATYYETKEEAVQAAEDMNHQMELMQARRNQETDTKRWL
jgi:hypothetical protein